jgi:hypothetical protein
MLYASCTHTLTCSQEHAGKEDNPEGVGMVGEEVDNLMKPELEKKKSKKSILKISFN